MITKRILDVPVAVAKMEDVIGQVNLWVTNSQRPRLVAFTNVHMIVEAFLKPHFMSTLKQMDLNCPDGYPVYWLSKQRLNPQAERIAGPEFMPRFCEQSVKLGHRHYLYGGGAGVAEEACAELRRLYPGIQVVGRYSPPFRELSALEVEEIVIEINSSKADVVWVSLGCPKQELWMNLMRNRLDAKVILAVGQAFDILAGRTRRAPAILAEHGGEWLYRLAKEPRRLWKRYLVTNLLFVLLAARELLTTRQRSRACVRYDNNIGSDD